MTVPLHPAPRLSSWHSASPLRLAGWRHRTLFFRDPEDNEVAAFGIASHLLLTPFGYPRLMYLTTNNRVSGGAATTSTAKVERSWMCVEFGSRQTTRGAGQNEKGENLGNS